MVHRLFERFLFVIFTAASLQIFSGNQVHGEVLGQQCSRLNMPGVCRDIYQCQPILALVTDPDPRVLSYVRNSFCEFRDDMTVVCCPYLSTPRPPTTPQIDQPQINNRNPIHPVLRAPFCGFSMAQHGRIVGGGPAELNAWPWIAVLHYSNKSNPNGGWLCAGSLISERHVLTAAHCIHSDLDGVRLGEHDLARLDDGANPVDVPVEGAYVHPGYKAGGWANDIAVIKLAQDVKFTLEIHPICLPLPDVIGPNRNLDGSKPFLAGWGSVLYNGFTSSELLDVQVDVIPTDLCKQSYRTKSKKLRFDDSVICAGDMFGGKGACTGDSGGSLMLPENCNQFSCYYAIGIVSYSFRCAEAGFPGVFTRVTSYLDFILGVMEL